MNGAIRRTNLLTSLMLVFPLFLVYQVGVLALPSVYNGADLITSELLHLLHGRLGAYLVVNAGLLLVFLVLMVFLRGKNEFHARMFLPVVLESAAYAVTMGALIVFVMRDVLHVSPNLQIVAAVAAAPPEPSGLWAKIVLACGAGVHEELLFRLFMIPAVAFLCEKALRFGRGAALAVAFLVSAFLFSAAHHLIGGEPWRVWPFVYRLLCGLFFAALFQWRGFAVDVYTHTIYDVIVLVLHA